MHKVYASMCAANCGATGLQWLYFTYLLKSGIRGNKGPVAGKKGSECGRVKK